VGLSLPAFVTRLLSPFRSPAAKKQARRPGGTRAEQKAKAAEREAKRKARAEQRTEQRGEEQRRLAEREAEREAKRAARVAARRVGRTFHVVSFPKSGRTWLRVMLDELKLDAKYTHDGSGHSRTGHVEELEPASEAFAGKTIVFLYRDPRDTVVSGYFQTAKRLGGYDGTISDFVRDPRHGVEKIIRFNMEWLARGAELGRFHAVTYEDLKADTPGALATIVGFVGAERLPAEIATVVDEASFEKMQARERSGELAERYGRILAPADSNDPQSFKVREGIVGGFRKHLGEDEVAFCDGVIARLGYPLERHGSRDA
jgi:hypothetical protein